MLATDGKVRVDAPLLYNCKAEIQRIGFDLKMAIVPYHLTRTCYKDPVELCANAGVVLSVRLLLV